MSVNLKYQSISALGFPSATNNGLVRTDNGNTLLSALQSPPNSQLSSRSVFLPHYFFGPIAPKTKIKPTKEEKSALQKLQNI